MEIVIGAVIHNETLTMVIRRDNFLEEPIQLAVSTPEDAVALLLEQKSKHRHENPMVYFEAGSVAGPVLDGIRRLDVNSRDQSVHGSEPASTSAGGGVQFYNRRSELHYRFRQKVEEGKLSVPAVYHEQIVVFGEGEERDGKIFFPSPLDVAKNLGRFPVLAVGAFLAAIDSPGGGTGTSLTDWDPYAPTRD